MCCLRLPLHFYAWAVNLPPPTVETVEERFNENYDDILAVVSFMANSGYEKIQIRNCSEKMYADLKWVAITESSINAATKELLGTELYKGIYKRGNTIEVLQWTSSQSVSCGIAYTINGIDPPDIQYMTEIVPLAKDGWYYYVADYNEWRLQQTT